MVKSLWAAVCLCAAFAITGHANTIVSTNSFWDDGTIAFSFGNDVPAPLIGQTVTVPVGGGSTLASFTFTLLDDLSDPIPFVAEVRPWDPVSGGGSPIYSAAGLTIPSAGPQFNDYTFSPNIDLTSGGVYLLDLFAEPSATPGHEPFAAINISKGDVYTDGQYVYATNNGTTWFSPAGEDLDFTAVFTGAAGPTTPEPAGAALVVLGGALAALWRRRGSMK